jgi:hypothetical protein
MKLKTTKQISLLKGFNGLGRMALVVSERRELPIQVPLVSILKGQTNSNAKCVVYFKMEQDSIISEKNFNGRTVTKLVNYCKNNT